MATDLLPFVADALAPCATAEASPTNHAVSFREYLRDVSKLFLLWRCDNATKEEIFKIVLCHRAQRFHVAKAAMNPLEVIDMFGVSATLLLRGLRSNRPVTQAVMLEAHKAILAARGNGVERMAHALKEIVVQHPELALDICAVTHYSGYWVNISGVKKRVRDGRTFAPKIQPMLVTNLESASGVDKVWIGENLDPVTPVSMIKVMRYFACE